MKRKKPLSRKARLKSSGVPMRARKKEPAKRRFAKHRAPALTDWIKQQGCLICAQRPVEPAHVIPRSRGSDDVDNTVPLCHFHHSAQEGRTAEFQAKYGVNLKELAKNYTKLWRDEFGEAA